MRLILILLLPAISLAEGRPSWTSKTPSEGAGIIFIVGRSPVVASEAEGVRMASKDAREQLLRQEFGTTIRVESVQKETLKDVELDSRLNELSDMVLLKGFKQLEVYHEVSGSGLVVWTLNSVPRAEVASESERIEALRVQKQKLNSSVALINSPSREFDNGGKPKLRKGLKKSQVIEMFGTPIQVERSFDMNSARTSTFMFKSKEFCLYQFCSVSLDSKGKVRSWYEFKPEYTTDLDDIPQDTVDRSKEALYPIKRGQHLSEGEKRFNTFVMKSKKCLEELNAAVVPWSQDYNHKKLNSTLCNFVLDKQSSGKRLLVGAAEGKVPSDIIKSFPLEIFKQAKQEWGGERVGLVRYSLPFSPPVVRINETPLVKFNFKEFLKVLHYPTDSCVYVNAKDLKKAFSTGDFATATLKLDSNKKNCKMPGEFYVFKGEL